jgi:hypothetical protein
MYVYVCDPLGYIALVEEDFEWVTANLVSTVTRSALSCSVLLSFIFPFPLYSS